MIPPRTSMSVMTHVRYYDYDSHTLVRTDDVMTKKPPTGPSSWINPDNLI